MNQTRRATSRLFASLAVAVKLRLAASLDLTIRNASPSVPIHGGNLTLPRLGQMSTVGGQSRSGFTNDPLAGAAALIFFPVDTRAPAGGVSRGRGPRCWWRVGRVFVGHRWRPWGALRE